MAWIFLLFFLFASFADDKNQFDMVEDVAFSLSTSKLHISPGGSCRDSH